jgi:hypothetical protein
MAGGNDLVFSNDVTEAPAPKAEEKPAPKKAEEKKEGGTAKPGGPQATLGRDWPASDRVSIGDVDHRAWGALLKRYVDAEGRVAYSAWKRSAPDLRALEAYLDTLSRADPERPTSREARLAFWINAYNALTVCGILQELSTAATPRRAEPGAGPDSPGGWLLRVSGRSYSLGQIEDEILRPMGEPRVHFAIVCGARGCPRLLNEGYSAAGLEEQLARNSRAFFADRTKFAREADGRLRLSAILDWYADDFGKTAAERLRTIAPYLPDERSRRLAESGVAGVDYFEYDWNLNDRPSPPPGRP